MTDHVLWLQGLEAKPTGSKYRALVDAGFDVVAPDVRGMNLLERVAIAKSLLQADQIVAGSSYGGITAVLATLDGDNRSSGIA